MKESISKKQLREFGFLLGLGIPVFIGWVIPAIGGHMFRTWTLWIGLPSLITGITQPSLLLYPYKGWMKLGHVLGWINSRIILGIVFIVVLQPISFFMRLFVSSIKSSSSLLVLFLMLITLISSFFNSVKMSLTP